MSQINDCIVEAIGVGQINDDLLRYYKSHGATSDDLNDAEYQFLVSQGATATQLNDMWFEYLTGEGLSGALNDMKAEFWCGGGAPLPAVPRVLSSTVDPTHPDGIQVKWDRPMRHTGDVTSQISVIIDGAPAIHPTTVDFHPTDKRVMAIVLPVNIPVGAVVSWAYTVGANKIEEIAAPNAEADNQTYAVNNKLPVTAFGDGFGAGLN